ncbi:MAG: hypothetical protein PVG65_04600 [Candidatus Thorarchaeota archaeon]|jgi:hypothetical protein
MKILKDKVMPSSLKYHTWKQSEIICVDLKSKRAELEVLEAVNVLNSHLYLNNSCPSDLTDEEYQTDILHILNNPHYKNDLIEANEMYLIKLFCCKLL